MIPSRFNVRVYGILIAGGRILVTDEVRLGVGMTKFPGGGLKFGEGLSDALEREWNEELNISIEVGDLVYVNPFLQVSAFRSEDQVLCIYYEVKLRGEGNPPIRESRLDFGKSPEGSQSFFWIDLETFSEDDLTFPIDKSVVPIIRNRFLPLPSSQKI